MKLFISHDTRYDYAAPTSYSIQALKLTPRRDSGQITQHWRIFAPGRRVEQVDAYGNTTHLLTLEVPHREIRINVAGMVETSESFDGSLPNDGALSPLVYLTPTPLTLPDATIEQLANRVFTAATATRTTLNLLMETIYDAVRYRSGTTLVTDTAAEALARGVGVCQDQAQVAIATCRAAGLPARYVSGYVLTGDADHAASHAWLDVWLDSEQRWVSCDVTHRAFAGPRLCRLAVGRDYLDAAPIRGVRRGGGIEQLEVNVIVSDSAIQDKQQ